MLPLAEYMQPAFKLQNHRDLHPLQSQIPSVGMANLTEILKKMGQIKMIEVLDSMQPDDRAKLESQIQQIRWEELNFKSEASRFADASEIEVVSECSPELTKLGAQAYEQGQVAVFLLAGGAGTRLGLNGPKGCVTLFEDTGASLYEYQANKVKQINEQYGTNAPLVIATSEATHTETIKHFEEKNIFDLPKESVHFVKQPSVPIFTPERELMRNSEGALLLSPNGNGGCFEALVESNTLESLKRQGVKYLVHVQVDNVKALAHDPGFVGLMASKDLEFGVKLIEMQDILAENLASVVFSGSKLSFVEYSERSEEHNTPTFRWGSPSLFCWGVDFLSRVAESGAHLPYHEAEKEVDGQSVLKYERFMFDLAEHVKPGKFAGYEIGRDEFMPIKRLEGGESLAQARELLNS